MLPHSDTGKQQRLLVLIRAVIKPKKHGLLTKQGETHERYLGSELTNSVVYLAGTPTFIY